jgi:hypothetical protein
MGQNQQLEENLSDREQPDLTAQSRSESPAVADTHRIDSPFPALNQLARQEHNSLNLLGVFSEFGSGAIESLTRGQKAAGQKHSEGSLLSALNENAPFMIVESSEKESKPEPEVRSKQSFWGDASQDELTPEQNDRLQSILKDPSLAASSKKLLDMLDPKGSVDSRLAATSLLSMLASTDKQDKEDGIRLLKMLGDQSTEGVAKQLLNGIMFNRQGVQDTLALLSNPGQKDAAKLVLDLLNSKNEGDNVAAQGLVRMVSDRNPLVRKDAQELMKMLGDNDQKSVAKSILTHVDDNGQVGQLLSILHKSELKQAGQELLKLLDSDKSGSASELLRLINSKSPEEKSDGLRLLKLLNAPEQRDRANAAGVLESVPNADQRRYLIDKLESPESKSGAQKLLEMMSSTSKKEREIGEGLLSEASREGGSRRAEKLITLLGGNEQQQAVARTVLTRVREPGPQNELLNLLASKENAAAGKEIVSMLNGSADQRTAARNMLEFAYNKVDRPAQGTYISASEQKSGAETIKTLLKKIASPAEQGEAVTMLKSLQNISQATKLFDLMNNPAHKDASRELLKMLDSKNYSEQRSATAVLEMLGARASVDPDGQRIAGLYADSRKLRADVGNGLLKMLGKPEERDAAKQMLSDVYQPLDLRVSRGFPVTEVPGLIELKRAQNLIAQAPKDGEQLMSMLKKLDTRAVGKEMLSSLSSSQEIKQMLDFLSKPENEKDANQLRELTQYLPVGKTGNLMKMLVSENSDTRSTGEELLKRLQNPLERFDVQSLLSADLSAKNVRALNKLLTDVGTKPTAEAIKEMLSSGAEGALNARALLRMSDSDQLATRQAFSSVVKMLSNPQQSDIAKQLVSSFENISTGDSSTFERMVQALGNEKECKGAQELIKLMKSGEDGINPRAIELMAKLNDGEPRTRQTAEIMLQMLGDPDKSKLARNLVDSLRTDQWTEFLKQTSSAPNQTAAQKEISKQLTQLMGSNNPLERIGVSNLIDMLKPVNTEYGTAEDTVRLAAGKHLLGMLGAQKEQANARGILTKLERTSDLVGLAGLLKDPSRAAAGRMLTDMLRSNNPQEVQSATAFIRALSNPDNVGFSGDLTKKLTDGVNRVVSMLGKPETRDLAKLGLSTISQPAHVANITEMLADKRFHGDLKKLNEMARSPGDAQTVNSMLDSLPNAKQISAMLALKDKQPAGFEQLASMLNNENGDGGLFPARRALELLSSNNPAEKRAGNEYVKMLSSDSERAVAQKLLSNLLVGDESFLQLMRNPQMKNASDALLRMMENGDDLAVNTLMGLLQDGKKEQRTQGESLLNMLNDPKYESAAIRMLRKINGGPSRSGYG